MEESGYESIIAEVVKAHYQKRLINNTHRADYVEAMIALTLGERWNLVSRYWDWAPWDLERDDGVRLEVKQSAAIQPWTIHDSQAPRSFDIAPRTGYWDHQSRWHAGEARYADIYVFAWHRELDSDIADHRNPDQWRFFVAPEYKLPAQKSISLNPLKKLAMEATHDGLLEAVNAAAATLPLLKRNQLTLETERRLDALVKETGCPKSYYLPEVIEKGIEDVEDYYLAHAVMERVRKGAEKVYSAAEVRADLELDCRIYREGPRPASESRPSGRPTH